MSANEITIRITGPGGSGKQAVVNFMMEAFRNGGCDVGNQMEGTDRGVIPVPYDCFTVASPPGNGAPSDKWGLYKNKIVRVPKEMLDRLTPILIDQGFAPAAIRHELMTEFLDLIADGYAGCKKNDGVRFEADRAQYLFEGFCIARGVKP